MENTILTRTKDFDFDDAEPERTVSAPKVRRALRVAKETIQHDDFIPAADPAADPPAGIAPSALTNPTADGWTQVSVAGPSAARNRVPLPTRPGTTTQNSQYEKPAQNNVKKGGWAKVEKIPKGQETKWGAPRGAPQESDEWDNYARNLSTRRDKVQSGQSKKKKNNRSIELSDDEEDAW